MSGGARAQIPISILASEIENRQSERDKSARNVGEISLHRKVWRQFQLGVRWESNGTTAREAGMALSVQKERNHERRERHENDGREK
jgi:hypothetical protein